MPRRSSADDIVAGKTLAMSHFSIRSGSKWVEIALCTRDRDRLRQRGAVGNANNQDNGHS